MPDPQMLIDFGPRLLTALLILALGIWGAKLVRRINRRLLTRRNIDPTLINFTGSLLYALLVTLVVVAALGQLGVQTGSMIAVLGAAGLAIALAFQNSLGNLASGLMILLFHPFRVGDVIEAAGVIGTVEDLHVFTTQLRTGDNKTVYIPNGQLTGGTIVNYSQKGTRRMDLVIGVSYDDDIRQVKQVLQDAIAADNRILTDPPAKIAVFEFADSSVNFAVRPWVNAAEYWDVYFDLMESIKQRFDEAGITIPFPQRDVRLHQQS